MKRMIRKTEFRKIIKKSIDNTNILKYVQVWFDNKNLQWTIVDSTNYTSGLYRIPLRTVFEFNGNIDNQITQFIEYIEKESNDLNWEF